MNEQTLDQELQYEIEHKDFVQDIVDKVYPHIATKLGPSDYFDEIPPVELWQDIYARLSGIPGSMGEESESSKAQFDENTNKIFIYYPNMADEEDVIKSLLHEYTHHLQDPEKWEEYRAEGYDNNPYETASRKAEENWKDYVIYLQDNPPVNIGDTVKITETKLESNGDLLNEILLVIGFEDDGTPVTVNESDTLLEGVTTHPITINLLESEFSWFKDKSGTDKKTKGIEPDWSIRRGRQHYAMNVEDTPNEPVTAFNTYLVKNSPFNYMGFDYYLTAVPDNMPHSARIDVFVPMLDTGYNADKLWSGERIRYYEDLGIDDFDYDYEEEEASPYIMQNPILHDIGYNTKWGEHYDYDERFRDGHPEETLKYDNRESDYLNYPGALYNRSWMERYSDLKNEMDELGKLFGIEGILINRYPDRPWMRQEDSYGNQNIRPGKDVPRKLNEAVATQDLIKKFLKDFWPKHRSQLYRDLYKTYHPSTYVESFNRPSSNFEDALEIVADAVHEGKKLGLIDSSVDWSDIYNYEDSDGYSNPDQEKRLIDDDGIPTLNDQLEIMDNTNLDWVHGILLFDVLEEIVDEFKHYCGENGIDESGIGKCMDEFPPSPNTWSQPKPYAGGTLKQDYYTLYNFMRELERAGIPVTDYLKDPTYPNIIKLVDDGTTDYNEEGGERTSEDWDNTRTQIEFEMDAPDRLDEAFYEDEEGNEAVDPQFLRLMSNVKKLMEYETYDSFERVLIKYFGYNWPETTAKIWLILKHNMEVVYPGTTLEELLNNKKLILKFPRFYEYWVKYKDSYSSHQREEECDSEGFGEESGEDCECDKAIKYVKSEDGYEEEEDCTDDWNDGEKGEDCECEEFAYKDVEVYYYPLIEVQILSTIDAEEMLGYNADYQEFEDFLEDRFVKLSEDTDDYELEEDAQTWDYFGDNEEGEIYESGVDEEGDGAWYINQFMREILGKDESTGISEQYQHTTPLKNQTDGQLNLFPTGTWEFPVGWDEESIESVTEGVPEKAITYIFKQWDEEGINFRDLKLLGIRVNSDIAVFLLKRYLQNTTKPVIASHVFACDDLANLFDDTNRDYDLSYIKEFLCGDDSFWDSQDWYNYEWDEYMTDQIDENNWKTISEIFGGVSQSDAEDILNRSSSSEEVDELTEKYDEEIDEIRTFIVWAHNDEHEWAVKDGMRKDILDELADHFGADGELYRSDEDGSYSWHFEDDLRSWVNDGNTWDNIERFEFHPDYAGTTLEDSLITTTPQYLNEKTLFAALIDEEYMFHDYCEGKKGECLQVDTKFFDGYWHPDYDINESLQDRLGELTYEPQITSGPEGEIKPIQEQEEEDIPHSPAGNYEKDYVEPEKPEEPQLDKTPFTSLDIKILNRLAKAFESDELTEIWKQDETNVSRELHTRYKADLKLFGIETSSWEKWASATRFAKWADDNWAEAERIKQIELGVTPDSTISELDFGLVTNPVKEWPSMYEIDGVESYWAKEYRYGTADVPGYGRNNAASRAQEAWWEYDVDMEYGDQGDTDDHELEIDAVRWRKSLREARIRRLLREQDTPKKELNPEVQEGDVIKLVYMDDPWANITPGTLGVVTGFESTIHGSDNKDKILVHWILGKDKFTRMPLLKDVDTYMLSARGKFDDEIKDIYDLQEQNNPEDFEAANNKREDGTEEDTIYNDPFTPLEIRIINQLHNNFERHELKEISNRTPHEYGELNKRYWGILKLFGIAPSTRANFSDDPELNNTQKSVYARLAYDNWTEDGNYKDIKAPIRTPLKWYNVYKDETGSQVEYKSGEARIAAFDEEGAEEKAEDDFYDWGGEMETIDYGDYETYDEEITDIEFDGLAEQRSLNKWKQKLLEQKQNKKIDEWLDEKSKTLKEAQEDRKTGKDLEKELTPEDGYEVHEPFTRKEVIILNHIIKNFTIDELNQIWESDESILASGIEKRYINSVKLFGIPTEIGEQWAFSTRFARWAVDNHKEAQGEDMGDDSIDYSRVGTAIKAYPSMYEVEGANQYWQRQTETGIIDIPGYDSDDARDKAYNAWWDYDPEMEVVDWGDTDDHELTIDDVVHTKILQTEESDVFGQGLLDPIDPEEFEGDEEEWEKLLSDVEDDEPEETEPTYDYQGGKTDPSKGFVAPSAEVTNNICKVKGFCTAQGPITFGQLRELVEAATSKRIKADMGRGVFKTLWRVIPFFIPQVLLAAVGITVTRAINKIITPALTDTRGYKSWWGKAVLKAMDIAEGDYIPDRTLGDDPLSKIFFISDGLLQMIRDKYKLKFARYVAEVAASEPDNKPVPEWFVENLLRDYLNQKFLLDPPLPIKQGIDKEGLTEHEEIPDWKDQILKHEEQLSGNKGKYKKISDIFDGMSVTVPVRINEGRRDVPEIPLTDITFTVVQPLVFKGLGSTFDDTDFSFQDSKTVINYNLIYRSVEPGSYLEEVLEEDSLEGDFSELLNMDTPNINHALIKKYFKLYGVDGGNLERIYMPLEGITEQTQRDNWQEDKPFSKETHDDTKLNVSSDALINYLENRHRERVIKELTPILRCIEYNCYDGWKDDPNNEWDEDELLFDEQAQQYCGDCEDELNNLLEKVDGDLVKLGLIEPADGDEGFIRKPFPYSYSLWVDGLVKEINPRFYVDANDDISYVEDRMKNQPTLFETIMDDIPLEQFKVENPEVIQILDRFPETLQRELAVERKNPQEFVKDFGNYYLNSEEPIEIYLEDELHKEYTIDTMSRTPQDVVDVINDTWDTDFESEEVFDPNPSRYFEYAELSPDTAPPSLMVNGEISYGVARFVAALLRGDETLEVWDIVDRKTISEQKESKLNPELMIGDEIMVVSTEGIHDFGTPELYKPYVVVGIKHGTTMMKGGKELEDYPYYQVEPVGMTDEDRTGAMLAGGGRMRPMYIFPRQDKWILRKGFLRGEHLTEHQQPGISPDLEVDDIIRVIDIDGEHARMPDRWGVYKVIEVKQDNATQEFYYDVIPYPSKFNRIWGHPDRKTLYRGDTWIPADMPMASNVDRKTISEHKESKRYISHSYEPSVGDKIVIPPSVPVSMTNSSALALTLAEVSEVLI